LSTVKADLILRQKELDRTQKASGNLQRVLNQFQEDRQDEVGRSILCVVCIVDDVFLSQAAATKVMYKDQAATFAAAATAEAQAKAGIHSQCCADQV
jgi:hypothetical protein